jgi:transposase-like protein
MKEESEVAWEEVPESGLEELPYEGEAPGEELGEKEKEDTPGPGRARATRKPPRKQLADGRPIGSKYPFDLRLRLVRLYTDKGVPTRQIAKDSGVGEGTVREWIRRYRKSGEAGLRLGGASNHAGREQIPKAVKGIIADTKRAEPTWGVAVPEAGTPPAREPRDGQADPAGRGPDRDETPSPREDAD